MKSDYVIDAHMHIGKAYKGVREASFEEYFEGASKYGIKEAVVIPPCISDFVRYDNDWMYMPFLFKDSVAVSAFKKLDKIVYKEVKEDPFTKVNRSLFEKINQEKSAIKLHFAPLMHPTFGNFSTFSNDEWERIVAIKIHPSFFKIGENVIQNDFFDNIEKINKPLIIHTGYGNSLGRDWLNILMKYDIKVLFAHACRLDPVCADIINSDTRYFVGISPYKRLNDMKQFMECDSFVGGVFDIFDIDKIVFDTDYSENINKQMELYWNYDDIDALGLSEEEERSVYYLNSKRLYGI